MHAREMFAAHPLARNTVNDPLAACIEACLDCTQTCASCADASLAERSVEAMRQTIRLCLDCSDLCATVGAMASRRTGSNEVVLRQVIETCASVCRLCAEECDRHAAHMRHCALCAEVCRACEAACRSAAPAVTAAAA
jgi:hypothetical protein